jgi:uncharacterized RDD family membrane protein YckC
MQVTCRQCQSVLEFSGNRPRFCSFCGSAIADTDLFVAETLAGPPAAPAASAVQDQVGDYVLKRELGRGGMGMVWEAEHSQSGRRVAVKLLSPRLPRTDETTQRFLREARAAASLSHPRSTFVFGAGDYQGQPYIVMELMPGRTLRDAVDGGGPMSLERAVDAILDVIDGLDGAHALGLVHRDVKPSNCFLDTEGRIKIGDFGLTKSLVSDTSHLTRTGTFLGTPEFAAPEQVRGSAVDRRTDIYAVAATLFYLLTGRAPFQGTDAAAVIAAIASEPAPRLRTVCPQAPKAMERIIACGLEKDPDRRYANLSQLRRELVGFSSRGHVPSTKSLRFAAFTVDAIVAGILGWVPSVIATILVAQLRGQSFVEMGAQGTTVPAALVSMLTAVLYFAFCETIWGQTLGKYLLGLKVQSSTGEPPGLFRNLLRAALVPGLGETMGAIGQWFLGPPLEPWQIAAASLVEFVPFGVMALMQLTMRTSNGNRGLHEFASGTRTVRMRQGPLGAGQRRIPVLVARKPRREWPDYGPYHVVGEFGTTGGTPLLLARDESLARQVWIDVRPAGSPPPSQERRAVNRPGRLRWLQGGTEGGADWDAYEPVSGLPAAFLASRGWLPWERARHVIQELAEELLAGQRDGSLPQSLTLDQVWVDKNGRARLLDEELKTGAVSVQSPFGSEDPRTSDPVEFLKWLAGACAGGEMLPVHAQRFVEELNGRPSGGETLEWAVRTLRESAEQRTELRWDDRLGIFCPTWWTEFPAYQSVVIVVAIAAGFWSPLYGLALAALAAFLLPAIVGAATKGGGVFRVMGLALLTGDGRPASRARCAVRSFVAWLPWSLVAMSAALAILLGFGPTATGETSSNWGPAGGNELGLAVALMFAGLGALVAIPVMVIGVIVSLLRPSRGIPDLIARTWLVHR